MAAFEKLFNKAGRGLHFNTAKNTNCILLLEKMIKSKELISFTLLLQLL
jgi:hypothetical protein